MSKVVVSLDKTFPPNPVTERGKYTLLRHHEGKDALVYTNRRICVFRSVTDGTVSDVYGDHAGANITAAAYSPNGNYICTGDERGKIRVWAPYHAEKVLKLELQALAGPIYDIDWSPDSTRIVVAGNGRQLYAKVFAWDTGSNIGEVVGNTKSLNSVSFKPTRPFRIATGGDDMTVTFHEGPPFKFVSSLTQHTNFINAVRFSPDGNFLATASADRKIILYDAKEATPIGEFGGDDAHTGGIYGIAWRGDSKQLVTVSADRTAKVWDVESRICLKTMSTGDLKSVDQMLVGVVWHKDSVVALNLAGDLLYFDPEGAPTPVRQIHGHQHSIAALAFDSATQTLFSADTNSTVCTWDINSGSKGKITGIPAVGVNSFALSEGHLVASSSSSRNIAAANIADLKAISDSIKMDVPVLAVVAVPNSNGLVFAITKTSLISVLSPLSQVAETQLGLNDASSLAVSADGSLVAIGTESGSVVVFDRVDQTVDQPRFTITIPLKKRIGALAFSPNGAFLAAPCANEVRLINVADAVEDKAGLRWTNHTSIVTGVAWLPNSSLLLSVGADSDLRVWNPAKAMDKVQVKGAHLGFASAVVAIDDNTIATGGEDGAIRIWRL